MNFLSIFLQAQPAAQGQGGGAGFWIMMVAFIAIFYLFLIRPQQKRQKKEREFREKLQKGDRVVTSGGIHGKVHEINDNTIVIDIANQVYITVEKSFIQPYVEPKAEERK
ncbi:MAG: preprotein translocase subunit YajC [Bacteroidales bacterium]|nr:preprotein translocase subunit YajC [Bacteroidales bacterium]